MITSPSSLRVLRDSTDTGLGSGAGSPRSRKLILSKRWVQKPHWCASDAVEAPSLVSSTDLPCFRSQSWSTCSTTTNSFFVILQIKTPKDARIVSKKLRTQLSPLNVPSSAWFRPRRLRELLDLKLDAEHLDAWQSSSHVTYLVHPADTVIQRLGPYVRPQDLVLIASTYGTVE